jgi:hypothetical protein
VQATAALGRTADRAVEEPCAGHHGPATPPANSQLSTHDRLSGTHSIDTSTILDIFTSADMRSERC